MRQWLHLSFPKISCMLWSVSLYGYLGFLTEERELFFCMLQNTERKSKLIHWLSSLSDLVQLYILTVQEFIAIQLITHHSLEIWKWTTCISIPITMQESMYIKSFPSTTQCLWKPLGDTSKQTIVNISFGQKLLQSKQSAMPSVCQTFSNLKQVLSSSSNASNYISITFFRLTNSQIT